MSQLMPFREYVARWLAQYIASYLPPPVPKNVTLKISLESTSMPQIEATPPAYDTTVIASLELHYILPGDVTETVLSLTTEPVTFDVPTSGTLVYYTVAVGVNSVKSDPSTTDSFDVIDLNTKPTNPGNVTLRQVA